MRKLILSLLLLTACGAPATTEPVTTDPIDAEAQALGTNSFWNSSGTLPSPSTHFCHSTLFMGVGGHNGAPYSIGSYEYGASFQLTQTPAVSASAFPNWLGGGSGSALATVQCDPLTRFGVGAVLSYPFVAQPTSSSTLQFAETKEWDTRAICYLEAVRSVSGNPEYVHTYRWGGDWYVDAYGTWDTQVIGRCMYSGHTPVMATSFTLDQSTKVVQTTLGVNAGICLIVGVAGNLDDGSVSLTDSGGNWRATIASGVDHAMIDCWYN